MNISLFELFFSRKKTGFAFLILKHDDMLYEDENDKKMVFGMSFSLEKEMLYINIFGYVAEINLNTYL